MNGLVFDVQKFSVHDGPGIRTTVFLKGCPLHCSWCHNPESNSKTPQLMFYSHLCKGCGRCVRVCPNHCLYIDEHTGKSASLPGQCTLCGACAAASVCDYKAREITGKEMSAEEVMRSVLRDRRYYESSGGGVTVSGGEALMQPAFTAELLRLAKKAGLHTAVETSGFGSTEAAKQAFEYADLLLYDIKHMDPERHIKWTGVSTERIHENLRMATLHMGKPVWIRLPLIHAVNDSEQNIRAILDFVNEFRNQVKQVWLLPYHDLGLSKLEALGLPQDLHAFEAPSEEWLQHLADIIRGRGYEPHM